MVDRIDKELGKLGKKQIDVFKKLLGMILAGNLTGLDVVKLKGHPDIYRVRKGTHRTIFTKDKDGLITVIAFEHRSDTTYHSF